MSIQICGAPCCWGVDDPKNPYLPPWQRVLKEAAQAGYSAIELGPYGYLPIDVPVVAEELNKNGLAIVAGTIFHDLLDPANQESVLKAVDDICRLITDPALPKLTTHDGQKFPTPYMTVMDWGHDERDYAAGHPDKAPRLSTEEWARFMGNVRAVCERANQWGVRPVIHPHAGGYIEFADEIEAVTRDIPYEIAGLCLDTGHLYYSGMNPVEWLKKYADRLDYVHFKDVDEKVYQEVLGEHIRFFDGCGKGAMCPIGTGSLDYPAIRQTLDEIGYAGYITIEQERDPRNADTSLRDVKASVDYLKSVGYQI
jgi:inosose dehydratase